MKRRNKNKFLSSETERTSLSKSESAKLRNTLAMSMAATIGSKYLEHIVTPREGEKPQEEIRICESTMTVEQWAESLQKGMEGE